MEDWKVERQANKKIIEEKFKYKRQKYITEQTVKEIIKQINYDMNNGSEQTYIDEYGNVRLSLDNIRIFPKAEICPNLRYNGRKGDYQFNDEIILHPRCNFDKIKQELEKYYLPENKRLRIEMR